MTPPISGSADEAQIPQAQRHNNCFDLLRLVLALSVLYTHTYHIGNFGTEGFKSILGAKITIGELAVCGFFAISGYLITQSFDRSSSLGSFLWKRVLRIFPAFWVCLLMTAVVFGPLVHASNAAASGTYPWTGDNSALGYAVRNALLKVQQWSIGDIQTGLPGVTATDVSINGSLWTLWPEFKCYLLTAFLGICLALRGGGRFQILLLYFFIFAVRVMNETSGTRNFGPTILAFDGAFMGLMQSYLGGMLLYAFREDLKPNHGTLLFSLVMLGMVVRFGGADLFAPVFMPVAVISFGFLFRFAVKNDISYGAYIYGFPVQVWLSCFAWTRSSPMLFLTLSIILTAAFATVSWFLVEKPCMAFKARRREAAPAPAIPIDKAAEEAA